MELGHFGKEYAGEKAIISLTSWKVRINTVGLTIFNLLKTCPGFHIVLVLAEEEFPSKEAELPKQLVAMANAGLFEILWVERNWKSLKKVLFTLLKYSHLPVISADDDCIYTCNYADQLVEKYRVTNIPIITYNRANGWCKTEGPCTLYNPPREIFISMALAKYNNSSQDDSVISEVISELKIETTYVVEDPNDFPFVFHTTESALNPGQYQEFKYKKCLMSSV